MILRTSTSHEEGVMRDWSINTKRFSGENGKVKKLHGMRLELEARQRPHGDGGNRRAASSSSTATWCCWRSASSVRSPTGSSSQLGLKLDQRGNVAVRQLP